MLMRRVYRTEQTQTWAAHAKGLGDGYVTFFHDSSIGTFRVQGSFREWHRFEFMEYVPL
jgi:hypothetical protein